MTWKVEKLISKMPKLNNPVLIEGMPGIGNVGKVAVDFMIAETKAEKFLTFFSFNLPNSVFVNENNLVDLPAIEMFYKKMKNGKRDIIFLAGDIQPTNEEASYEFCEKVLEVCKEMGCKEIITLGGIGLQTVSKTPKVYCTGNSKQLVEKYANGTGVNPKLYGVVGPIVGVSGLLLGLAKKKNISAVALLAETLAHPMYLGIRGGKEIIKVIDTKLSLKINIKKLEQDIRDMESDMTSKGDLEKVSKKLKNVVGKETSYIG
jgi:uncharacterized protein